ncbi:MAG: DUF1345 domain-containing protein [Alphaproteobacteria bacterium]
MALNWRRVRGETALFHAVREHVVHHIRFYMAVGLGSAIWALTHKLPPELRLVAAGDAAFLFYLVTMTMLAGGLTPGSMRERASYEDEGMPVIVVITLAAIGLSMASIFAILNKDDRELYLLIFTILSVPLGWLTFHTVVAFHYMNLFYDRNEGGKDAGGLKFPGTLEPRAWDFLYYSFVVGMTAQVSDVQVESSTIRRVTLLHGIVSFFFNTVLLALAVNVAAGQA